MSWQRVSLPPGLDVDDLVDDLGTLLIAAGNVLHLATHEFVETKEMQSHVDIMLSTVGRILSQFGGGA
jgi:hypothetical protein